MIKRFFQNLSKSFCVYLLTLCNLMHAISSKTFDWLLWVSLILASLSVFLNLITAVQGGADDA